MLHNIGLVLITIGLLGLALATFLTPVVATLVWFNTKRKINSCDSSNTKLETNKINLLIQIPVAPSSANSLNRTLSSLHEAMSEADLHLNISIRVVLDGADSQSKKTTQKYFNVNLIELPEQSGKWQIIRMLESDCEVYDWIASMDVGTIVNKDFFRTIYSKLNSDHYIAIYPSYRTLKRAFNIFWRFEAAIKYIENFAGGSISAHGAMMIFRASALGKAFKILSEYSFTNDDVILPLAIRLCEPLKEAYYMPNLVVLDEDTKAKPQKESKFNRRKRIALGNIQLFRTVFSSFNLSKSLTIFTLLMRRLFRLFWAYWLLFIVIGLSIYFSVLLPVIIFIALILYSNLIANNRIDLVTAFLCSILSPIWLVKPSREVKWA